MNLILNPFQFDSKNLFFLEKKKNNIIDGCFSKIIYSPEYFTMNGIYFIIPFVNKVDMSYARTSELGSSIGARVSSGDNLLSKDNVNVNVNMNMYSSLENKYTIYFYTHDVRNLQYITLLSEIENTIINTYKEMNGVKKRNNLGLTNQLYKGHFKIYREKQQDANLSTTKKYMLKISGVWENIEEVGITYKFIEVCETHI